MPITTPSSWHGCGGIEAARGRPRLILGVVARLDRATQYAAASRLITTVCGILDRPLLRAMTVESVEDGGLKQTPRRWRAAPYRIGGAYCTPPAFHSWFMPRGIFSLDFSPMLRSYISP